MKHILLICLFVCVSVASAFTLQEANSGQKHTKTYFEFPMDRHRKARIVGGKEAKPHAYPYQAGLFISTRLSVGIRFCGGSLITQNHVLTAASCLSDAYSIEVYLGYHSLSEPESEDNIKVTTTSYDVHSGYNASNYNNDIGIVKLPKKIILSDTIKTVALDESTDLLDNKKCLVSGWGLTDPSAHEVASRLTYVEGTLWPNRQCKDFSPSYDIVTDTMICMNFEGHVGICSGDSGGPVIVDGKQAGIVSFGRSKCGEGPSVFTRVGAYKDWIHTQTSGANSFIKTSSYLLVMVYFLRKFIE